MNETQRSEMRRNVILALADCNMDVSKAARKVYMSRNGTVYYINQIKKITGKDPLNFFDLHDLVLCVKAEGIKGAANGL